MASAVASPTRLTRQPGTIAWLRLARAYQKLERAAADHLREWDLSVAQFDILAHVGAAPGLTQDEISRARLTTKGNLSQVLDRMERDGLVCRTREGRSKRVYLTEAGKRLFDQVVPPHEAFMAEQFDCLCAEERGLLIRFLRTLDRSCQSPGR